jgi:transposase
LGKTSVRVSDTPGFIVNRVARPFYLEALRIVESGADPGKVDALMREAGFRMGPLELADLIGQDINLSVSESLFERYYYPPRFRPSYLQRSMVEAGDLERLANRMAPCKDVGHGYLLQGHKDQGSGGGGSGHPKEGGRADLLRLPYHPQTLAEDEEGGQGPLAWSFYGPKTAHPRHPRREEAPVGPARRERRRHARAPLRAVGREDGRQGVDLGHEPGHPREARLDLQKKTLAATERDEQARGAFRERLRSIDSERLVFVDESSTNVALTPRYGRAPKGERSYGKAPRNWGKNVTLISSITLSGMGASMSIEGSSDTESFGIYMREVLAPGLKSGQIVMMDNLSVHTSGWVRELIEGRGCQLWLLPSYSPDFNPIEEAFSKVKTILRKAKARTLEALFEATARALSAVSADDAVGYFEHCGYAKLQDHPL